jgi:hypothetical protein
VTRVAGKKARTIGTCIFCQLVGPLEREHLLAAWTRSQLHQLLGAGYRRHRVFKGPTNPRITHNWLNPVATATVRCVCAVCNHGWMKSLEEQVMGPLGSLMRNGLKIVPVGDVVRRDLATWAFKTAAVGQELPSNHIKPIDASARSYLYARGEPPPNTVVWLSPSPEPAFDAVVMMTSVGAASVELGYFAQIVVGRISLAVMGSFTGQLLPFQPASVHGVEPIEIWPNRPGWSRSQTLPLLLQSGTNR